MRSFLKSLTAALCLLLCTYPYCYAQTGPAPAKGIDTAAIMHRIKEAKGRSNVDSSIRELMLVARVSEDGSFYIGAATALIAAGSRYSDQGRYTEALDCAARALPAAQKAKDIAQLAFCYNLFGVISFMQGEYVTASEQYFKALDVLKNVDSTTYRVAITVYTNLGALSSRMGKEDKALYYLTQGEAIARDERLTKGKAVPLLAGILMNKGNYFERHHIPDSAVRYYNEVLDIIAPMEAANPQKIRFQALTKINLASVFLQTGAYDKAVVYSKEGADIARSKYAFIALGGDYITGDALRHLGRYKEAEALLLHALAENMATNTRDEMVKGYATLIGVYKDTRQYAKALAYTDTLMSMKDSLLNAEKTKAVSLVESKYNNADKDRQIAKNSLLIAQQKNNLAVKNLWIVGSIGVCLLLAITLIGLYIITRQRQAGIIRSLKQENTINILKGVVQGEENERIRLAKDLHDGIGGILSATKMRFMALRHDNTELLGAPRYLEAMGLLDILGDEIRKTSHNLMPEVLLKQNLAEALNTYCNNLRTDADLRIDFQSFGVFDDLANDFKLNIYRIVQELLKNTMQHASATHVVVQLVMLEAYLTISVEDNGKGFNTQDTKDGIGLHNLKTRVLSHEGHYTVRSEPGKGTTVYIEFAMAREKKATNAIANN